MTDVLYMTDIVWLPKARAGLTNTHRWQPAMRVATEVSLHIFLTAMAARDACCTALRAAPSYPWTLQTPSPVSSLNAWPRDPARNTTRFTRLVFHMYLP